MVGHKLCVLLVAAVANEHLRCGYCDREAEFLSYFILIDLNLNSHMDVVDTEMDASAQDQRRRLRRQSLRQSAKERERTKPFLGKKRKQCSLRNAVDTLLIL